MSSETPIADTPDILRRILARKVEEIAAAADREPLSALARRAAEADAPRGLRDALAHRIEAGGAAVIAEVKKASPSRGVLRADFDPAAIGRSYAAGGAAALSVLTDRDFFQGDPAHLAAARESSGLPVLRKDFVIDPYQVYEARAMGADAILLIAAALGDAAMRELRDLAAHLGMDALIEVHDADELERALAMEPDLVGINNRDLRTFETDVATTTRLRERVPAEVLLVTESGIHTADDVAGMRANGVHAFLIGEAFMTAPDPGARLAELFGANAFG
ncbi:indole-3-glycerol phosphate synthase TrpC [Halofilum ochraceum]|uniref:indole-3-glycerol phosphate synthase TrpC n=1 Tax=Halofilum ochraceum TaxID=1611323 RepID=UPI0008D956EB|nr:indole-3-glycerol phosphate synthase TrpC [Halofilum ochraceum]